MIYTQLYEMAKEPHFSINIENMCNDGTIIKWLPEFFWMDNYIHNEIFHPEGNPLDHTLASMKVADNMKYDSLTKIAVMFHDIGKSVAAKNYNREKHPYHNFVYHEILGLNVFDCIKKRLNIPSKDANIIKYCIRNHMRVYRFDKIKNKHKIVETVLSPYWETLKKVCYADCASKGNDFKEDELRYLMKYGEKLARNVFY